ncbi:MAG: beta-N-acetylhexosaminidase, partial [Muribaculaceae bacterium]|nr:beta-N-acetylhexosaminidase [Muribaculaceae bacterium]
MKKVIFSLLVTIVAVTAAAQPLRADYRVVPLPDRIDGIKDRDFMLDGNCLIDYPVGNRDMERNAVMLSGYIEDLTGLHLSTRPTSRINRDGCISLLLDPKVDSDEGYRITVTARGVEIAGKTPAG